jgi:ankyrin repeat protein
MYYIGKAAFHLAALSGSQDIVKTLLDMKADINIQVGYACEFSLFYELLMSEKVEWKT